MKLAKADWLLAATLVAYIICDALLTPPAGLETRNPARVTIVGFIALGLLFVGLVLGIAALVLLFRGSSRGPIVSMVAAVLFLPAFLAEQTRNFSSLRPPAAIESIEIVQALVVALTLGVSLWLLRRGRTREIG